MHVVARQTRTPGSLKTDKKYLSTKPAPWGSASIHGYVQGLSARPFATTQPTPMGSSCSSHNSHAREVQSARESVLSSFRNELEPCTPDAESECSSPGASDAGEVKARGMDVQAEPQVEPQVEAQVEVREQAQAQDEDEVPGMMAMLKSVSRFISPMGDWSLPAPQCVASLRKSESEVPQREGSASPTEGEEATPAPPPKKESYVSGFA